ncbi:hypothetical protein A2U01_0038877, partial [Trifolium medium]|nr:hypothetical protein [Trifolium medium]
FQARIKELLGGERASLKNLEESTSIILPSLVAMYYKVIMLSLFSLMLGLYEVCYDSDVDS